MSQMINTLSQSDTAALKARLLTILASQSYIEGKITLSSGKESNYYVDGKKTTLDSEGGSIVSILFLKMLKPSISAIGGISVGADPIASGVSQLGYIFGRKVDAFYVRKEPKKHGTSKWIEGPMKSGSSIAIVEDVVTTGASSLKAIDKVIEYGCNVEQVLAIVDRNDGGREAFKSKGLKYNYLFDINEVIEESRKK